MKIANAWTTAAMGLAIFHIFAIGVEAQDYTYVITNDTITITGYIGPGGAVTIPETIDGLPVTCIGDYALYPCTSLTSITIPNNVTSIGEGAFYGCRSLTTVTVGSGVTNIGAWAFNFCSFLRGVYFNGNAPELQINVFYAAENVIVYYLPSTTGWGVTFGGRPTAQWILPSPIRLTTAPSFGIQTNRFGFIITGAMNGSVVVEASTTLINPVWSPVGTNALANGLSYFNDAQWTNYSSRFYRVQVLGQ